MCHKKNAGNACSGKDIICLCCDPPVIKEKTQRWAESENIAAATKGDIHFMAVRFMGSWGFVGRKPILQQSKHQTPNQTTRTHRLVEGSPATSREESSSPNPTQQSKHFR